jgi:hypothetical protein
MCTVSELITKLQTLPQDGIVKVKRDVYIGYGHFTEFAPVYIDEILVMDFSTPEMLVKRPSMNGKIFVQLSSDD